ncbi:hypothetical protein [Pedobacter helvus]|uniref:Uncharacterized protein n=1 Tax=Pedobacter helvus TaxID=2563444 RepID=A0ABW9JKS0_9SPHI|nr:hypothetical protein [Pedobacter ureilyticus]
MERKKLNVFLVTQCSNWQGQLSVFSFRTSHPISFYPFDRLYALKPKNPV